MAQDRRAFGQWIKESRVRAGLTQSDLARQLEVSRSTVIGWETGSQEPSDLKVEAVRRVLGAAPGRVSEPAPSYGGMEPAGFVEHVLFTAGRIAELANQIERAAAAQKAATYELGRRAQAEQGAPISPSREAIEEGVAGLDYVAREAAAKKPKRRRA